jgi:hypothetical protein
MGQVVIAPLVRDSMRTIIEFWHGDLPLGRAFWIWGILGGGVVSLFSTLLALALLAAEAPAWIAIMVFSAHIPWNLVLLVGVWRSTERSSVSRELAYGARLIMVAWLIALSVL